MSAEQFGVRVFKPARDSLDEVADAVRGCRSVREAWERLTARNHIPDSWADDPERRFSRASSPGKKPWIALPESASGGRGGRPVVRTRRRGGGALLAVGGAATRLFPGRGRWQGDHHESSTLLLVRADGKLVGGRWEGDVADTAAFCEEVRDARGLVGAHTVGYDSTTWWSGGVRRDPSYGDDIPAEPALRDAVDVQEAAVTCGLLRDGTVVCGGSDREGQLADGEAPPEEARPVLVAIPAER